MITPPNIIVDREKKRVGRKKHYGRKKILDVLVTADNYLRIGELKNLAGYSEAYCKAVLDQLWRSGHIEKISRTHGGNLWCITESGKQDYATLTEMCGFVPLEKRDTSIVRTEAHRQYLLQQEQRAAKKAEKEAKEARLTESFKNEKAVRDNESGIRKYFLYDLNHPIDMEIVKKIKEIATYKSFGFKDSYEEVSCKIILRRRLGLGCGVNYRDIDQLIENKLLQRCKQKGKTRHEYVRELFCIHFNLKLVEVG